MFEVGELGSIDDNYGQDETERTPTPSTSQICQEKPRCNQGIDIFFVVLRFEEKEDSPTQKSSSETWSIQQGNPQSSCMLILQAIIAKGNRNNNSVATPVDMIEALENEFGKLFDPCPIDHKEDGLAIPWKSPTYCNPPYDSIGLWLQVRYNKNP